jgi:hypothetical protein
VRVRLYIHAWQFLLMFIAGVISVIAAFAGYIHAGGGEEVLRRALARMETGAVRFDSLHVDWLSGEMVVHGLEKQNAFVYGEGDAQTVFEGLRAETLRVKMDVYPWPPEVTKITVSGIHNAAIRVSDGFLQKGVPLRAPDAPPLPPLAFEDCNLKITIGGLQSLELTGCTGELRVGQGNSLRGAFSLQQLNGKPFNFKLETLEDGRWVFAGDEIQIDTRQTLKGRNPLGGRVDPVNLLVAALFSGEMGATGTVKFLRVVVQPVTPTQPFVCDGEVGFRNLEFQLPPLEEKAGQVLPELLTRLLGMDEGDGTLWPRWMQVERIRTGPDGRVAFHMAGGKLNFTIDEGPGSALTGIRNDRELPPLESLKGWLEADAEGLPKRIILRGYLGNEFSFETSVQRAADKSRIYDLVLQPRTGDYKSGVSFNQPVWRFISRVKDYLHAEPLPPKDANGERPIVEFEMEGDARKFPWPELLLPGLRDIYGRIYAQGRFTNKAHLQINDFRFDTGAGLVYGGARDDAAPDNADFGPLWQTLRTLFDTPLPWTLQNVALHGKVDAQFGLDLSWESTEFHNLQLISGELSHAGLSSNLGVAGITLSGKHTRGAQESSIDARAEVTDRWYVRLDGKWANGKKVPATGEFRLVEKDVPFNLHPQRESLAPSHVSEDQRRVNRVMEVKIKNGKAERSIQP